MPWFLPRTMPGVLGAGLLLSGAASYALAQAPAGEAAQLKDFFAGTLEIDVPNGDWSARRWLSPDHTYRETGSDGEVTGSWTLEGDRVCVTPSKPPPGEDRAQRYCNLAVGKHAGDTWRDADPVTGNPVFFRLTPGR